MLDALKRALTSSDGASDKDSVNGRLSADNLPPKSPSESRRDAEVIQAFQSQQRQKMVEEANKKRKSREYALACVEEWKTIIFPHFDVMRKSSVICRKWWCHPEGLPDALRADVWRAAIGNPHQLSMEMFEMCVMKAAKRKTATMAQQEERDSTVGRSSSPLPPPQMTVTATTESNLGQSASSSGSTVGGRKEREGVAYFSRLSGKDEMALSIDVDVPRTAKAVHYRTSSQQMSASGRLTNMQQESWMVSTAQMQHAAPPVACSGATPTAGNTNHVDPTEWKESRLSPAAAAVDCLSAITSAPSTTRRAIGSSPATMGPKVPPRVEVPPPDSWAATTTTSNDDNESVIIHGSSVDDSCYTDTPIDTPGYRKAGMSAAVKGQGHSTSVHDSPGESDDHRGGAMELNTPPLTSQSSTVPQFLGSSLLSEAKVIRPVDIEEASRAETLIVESFPMSPAVHPIAEASAATASSDSTDPTVLLQGPLQTILRAFVELRPDIGYVQGMSYLAATLYVQYARHPVRHGMLALYDAFVGLATLMTQGHFPHFYTMNGTGMSLHLTICEDVLRQSAPDLSRALSVCGVSPQLYVMDWWMSLFSRVLPMPVAARCWDLYLYDPLYLHRITVALVLLCEPQLQPLDELTFDRAVRVFRDLGKAICQTPSTSYQCGGGAFSPTASFNSPPPSTVSPFSSPVTSSRAFTSISSADVQAAAASAGYNHPPHGSPARSIIHTEKLFHLVLEDENGGGGVMPTLRAIAVIAQRHEAALRGASGGGVSVPTAPSGRGK